MPPITPEETLKPELNVNVQLFIHCAVSRASLKHGTVHSSAPYISLIMRFTNLLCSHQTPRRTRWEVTSQRAAPPKLWEAQRAPANHVNASLRTTFPDASVFPLH